MTTNYDKLITVLKEVFMLDKAELDFGIYRIMNQKRADITQFLQQDLVPQVKTILAQNGSGDRKALEKGLDDAVKQAQALGIEPDAVPKVKELRAQLADIPDLTALENDVFSGLAQFFKRYFDNGDFISMRRYKRDVYAIPYEGEEVKLHWANADQYYIKTAEYLKHYRFRLDDTHHVSFDLLEASTEQNNNKAQGDKERRFALCHDRPLEVIGDTLHIYFTYEPTDKKRKQDELLTEATDQLKPLIPADFLALLALSPTEKNKNRTLLEKHLRDYTARNTFDYFIHKDLGGFLRRELDFYIKNEVLFLDDLDTVDDRQVLAQLAKVRALRQIGEKVIQFLAQLEDFQKRLWLKKKLVVDSQYCITLDRVPESFYDEIAQNEAQADEWVRLFAIDELPPDVVVGVGYSRPLTIDFLKQHQYLVLDTGFFTEEFKSKLIVEITDFEKHIDGLIINSENFQALRFLQERYYEQIRCVYVDPPYNAAASEIMYKNEFKHSSWLSMIVDRVEQSKHLMSEQAIFCITIDDYEYHRLQYMLGEVFGEENYLATALIRNNPSGRSTVKGFAVNHEYAAFFAKSGE
ncbi:DNA methyltransferase [Rudanella lutea]|uniref:DNA methyltransferase n=1 Tax=Rudanella lutea TaxID=451374 RepID=UPI00035F40B1|nr:DNA methyltransferase [Rudanella lutea]